MASADVYCDSYKAVDMLASVHVPDPGAAAAGEVDGLAGVCGLDVFGFGFDGGHVWDIVVGVG